MDKTTADKITLREFRMWMEGLLSGNEDRRSLPSLDQWRSILGMLERIEDSVSPPPMPQLSYTYTSPHQHTIAPYPYALGVTTGGTGMQTVVGIDTSSIYRGTTS